VLSKIFHRRLPVGDYWNNIGAPVVSYYATDQVRTMVQAAKSGVEIVDVDEAPQALNKVPNLLVTKSNATVVARREPEPATH
jgi:hypothetical protein